MQKFGFLFVFIFDFSPHVFPIRVSPDTGAIIFRGVSFLLSVCFLFRFGLLKSNLGIRGGAFMDPFQRSWREVGERERELVGE